MKIINIKDPIYKTQLDIFYDCTEQELQDKYIWIGKLEITGSLGKFVDWKWLCLIWVRDINDVSTIVHELLHFTFYIMNHRWVAYMFDISEEVFCYFQEYFLREYLKKLKLINKSV